MGDFEDAVAALHPMCKFCGEDRLIELIGRVWTCAVCGKDWTPPRDCHVIGERLSGPAASRPVRGDFAN